MVNILLNGYCGKMGQELVKEASSNFFAEQCKIVCGVDKDFTVLPYMNVYKDAFDVTENPNVIIDFSVPTATLNILKYAKERKLPVVIATTGFTAEQLNLIYEYSKYIPIFKSANMSYDINLMAKTAANIAKTLENVDIEIIETHHNRKIDSPSGTALFLADKINEALDKKMKYVYDRHSKHEQRGKNEIGISSIRGGNIVGEHTVQFFSENETFELKHTCYSRSVFANGALRAANWIIGKPNGMYSMDDLI